MPETYQVSASDETLEQEIKDLELSREGKELEEIVAIDAQVDKLEELHALPPVEVDNTIYWEGYYGKGGYVKELYNTVGGVHQNGGTPFEKLCRGRYTYDPVRDAFYAPQPFASWTLNEDTCLWESPIPYPDDTENSYLWDEETLNWILVE